MSEITRNIWFTSISTLIPAILTYVFWFLAARFAGPEAIGLASAIGSITIMLATIDVLDVSLGMKRSLGISFAEGDMKRYKQILSSALLLVSLTSFVTMVLLSIPQVHLLEMLGIHGLYGWLLIIMVPSLSFQYVFTEAIVAALRSKKLVMPLILGSLLRFPIFLALIYLFNQPTEATVVTYSILVFLPTILYAKYLYNFLPKEIEFSISRIFFGLRTILRPSLASWIPHMLSVLGSQLGIVTVFSVSGSSEGGLFYIPMAIFSVTLFLVTGMNKVSHPLIAGMSSIQDQTSFLKELTLMAFVFTLPLSTSLMIFSEDYLGLLGNEFINSHLVLSLLMVGVPFSILSEVVYYFVYGRGDNKMVLYSGLSANVPRIIFYFILVPIMGSNGAAVAYLTGSIIQGLLTVRIGVLHSIGLSYFTYIAMTLISWSLGYLFWFLHVNFVLALFMNYIFCVVIYIKLRIIGEQEVIKMTYATLPKSVADKFQSRMREIVRRLR